MGNKCLLVLMIMLLSPVLVSAQDNDKISTFAIIKADLVSPEGEEPSSMKYGFFAFWEGAVFGAGIDLTSKPEQNYSNIKPFLAIKKGSWYGIGGFSTSSTGSEYWHAGTWYLNKFGKTSVFLDGRNYFPANSSSSGYIDLFLEVDYSINNKWFPGLILAYDHWWESDSNWVMGGMILYYRLNKISRVFTRYTFERDLPNGQEAKNTQVLRLGLEFCF